MRGIRLQVSEVTAIAQREGSRRRAAAAAANMRTFIPYVLFAARILFFFFFFLRSLEKDLFKWVSWELWQFLNPYILWSLNNDQFLGIDIAVQNKTPYSNWLCVATARCFTAHSQACRAPKQQQVIFVF